MQLRELQSEITQEDIEKHDIIGGGQLHMEYKQPLQDNGKCGQ